MKSFKFKKGDYNNLLKGDLAIPREQTPKLRWTGKKIPVHLWRQVMTAFVDHPETEMCFIMMYSYEHGWLFHFPGQEVTSTSVKISHSKDKEVLKHIKNGYFILGNIHTHPKFGAFDSGIDQDQEKGSDGIYITIGHVDHRVTDHHIRTYINGFRYEGYPNLVSLIEKPKVTNYPDIQELYLLDTKHPVDYDPEWKTKMKPPKTKDVYMPASWGDLGQQKQYNLFSDGLEEVIVSREANGFYTIFDMEDDLIMENESLAVIREHIKQNNYFWDGVIIPNK
jgi:hypothetical protein